MARPANEAELVELLSAPGPAYELVAGGTKRGIGRPMDATLLDLSAFNGVVDYEPGELVLTARPATPLNQVESLLAAQGQRLAFEPPVAVLEASKEQTLGGVLMANASGSRRVTAGSARDHFIGFRAVNGRGEAFVGGGRVVKNVTGFDLPKVLAGSWGTLAALTEVTVRVVPAAESESTLLFPVESAASAVELCSQALGSTFDVSSAAVLPARGVALRLEGLAASVTTRVAGLLAVVARRPHSQLTLAASRQFWRQVGAAAALERFPVLWRLSVAPRQAARILEAIEPEDFQLDWGGGLIWIGAREPDAARIRAALQGGHATLIRANVEQRRETAAFEPQTASVAALAMRLKAAFDPRNRLNPGRMG
ncbi:MAG TPA: FAD-binding protein [Steroidobacteraceae bacterium]|nr:FAD-binding protein [Steroidobacteraceae bacterium]